MTTVADLEQLTHPDYNGRILVWLSWFGFWRWQLAYDCPSGTYGRSIPKNKRGVGRSMTEAMTTAKVTADRLGMPLRGWS